MVSIGAAAITETMSAPALAAISTSTRPASNVFKSATMVFFGKSFFRVLTALRPSLLIRGVPTSSQSAPPSTASPATLTARFKSTKSSATCRIFSFCMLIIYLFLLICVNRNWCAFDRQKRDVVKLLASLVTIAKGQHPFPFRIRSLSLSAPMVLLWITERESRSSPGTFLYRFAFMHIAALASSPSSSAYYLYASSLSPRRLALFLNANWYCFPNISFACCPFHY